MLPKARTDFRLPPEIYAFNLQRSSASTSRRRSSRRSAHAAFDEIQKEMKALARRRRQGQGLAVTDYRDVIRELKKEQLVGDAILPHYQARLKEIEEIISAREARDAAGAARRASAWPRRPKPPRRRRRTCGRRA